MFKVILGSFGACPTMACNSKMASRRAKRNEIWESWVVVMCIWGTFDLLVFKVILETFRARLKMASKLKTAGRRAQRIEIWDWEGRRY